jgi:DNA-directed RNA polymerase specialized sigma24 family protein
MDLAILIAELFEAHWRFVLDLLPSYGVFGAAEQDDLALRIWEDIHSHIAWCNPESPRTWILGFVRRRAFEYRRAHPGSAAPDADEPAAYTVLRSLEELVPDPDQREALMLFHRHGLTVTEIAHVVGTEPAIVKFRLERAQLCCMSWGSDVVGGSNVIGKA